MTAPVLYSLGHVIARLAVRGYFREVKSKHVDRVPSNRPVILAANHPQSITDALSSFSAHLTHLSAVLGEAGSRSLILLDEIGGGTDPEEGVALARSLLEDLAGRESRVLATTHYGQLKALVEEDDRFRHASMAFDPEQLRPCFELQLDLPGSSHAIALTSARNTPSCPTRTPRSFPNASKTWRVPFVVSARPACRA